MTKKRTNRPPREQHPYVATPTYNVWQGMKRRCLTPTNPGFVYYGARGITVCDRWRNSFLAFLADMGEKPEGLSLERKDNNGPYSPENCVWAPKAQQMRNTRRTRLITFNGETMCLADWATKLRMSYITLFYRLKTWPVERALTEPIRSEAWSKGSGELSKRRAKARKERLYGARHAQ